MTTDRYNTPANAPIHRCEHCNRPFAEDELLSIHKGLDHAEQLDDEELAAFERAYDEETDELRRYQIIAVGAIVLLYFGLLLTYALI